MSSSSDSGRRRTADALALVGLSGKGDEIAGDLPYGDQRRCEIGRSVASDPSFILMDEPSSGMNDIEAKAIVELVRTLAARGIGVVIVEHNMNIVRAVADTVVAMDLGRVIAQGTPEAVLDDPVVRGRFLGE
jgi:ABC-type branched-subunit amino acid transport system ATPase component